MISWFFLAQRHRYVRSLLHESRDLDIGSGEYKVAKESVGVDLRIGRRPDVVCSVLNLPFADGSFDACTMLEVIEHMGGPEQRQALKEVRRVLDREGQFIISTPNLLHGLFRVVWWFWERTAGRQWMHEHVGMLEADELQALLLSLGFVMVNSKRVAVFDRIIEAKKCPR
jgi:predicted SAM-dependent methyltransferase